MSKFEKRELTLEQKVAKFGKEAIAHNFLSSIKAAQKQIAAHLQEIELINGGMDCTSYGFKTLEERQAAGIRAEEKQIAILQNTILAASESLAKVEDM